MQQFRYFMLNKPSGMESQFVSPYEGALLGDLSFTFPEGAHAIGRLDKQSEGLLLLTTNKKITALLFQSKVPHRRTYLVQVRHAVSAESLQRLRTGVTIRIKGGTYYTTPPCAVDIVKPPADLWPAAQVASPYLVSTWLQITLTEGKYHQVRKMVGAVRHRCMRLIRLAIEDMQLSNLPPGAIREVDETTFFNKLKLETAPAENNEC